MKKTLFLAVAALGFFSVDADAGVIFKKKSKSCTSCNSSKAAVVAAPTVVQVAPQKKVQAPSPVKSQSPVAPQKKVEAPSPVKAQNAAPAKTATEKKKVSAPQQ